MPGLLEHVKPGPLLNFLDPEEIKEKPPFAQWLEEVSPDFTWTWRHLVYIREHLDAISRGDLNRLIIQCPPRHGKSELGTIRYPLYRLEQDPNLRVVVACYSQTLANTFSRKARRLAQGRLKFSTDRKAVDQWELTNGTGGFRAVGVGGSITGMGASLVCVDDPVKSREEAESQTYRDRCYDWFRDDLYTRLEPDGPAGRSAIILTMTRWHEDDLAGRILASEDGPNWKVINLPAICDADDDPLGRERGEALCPERYDVEALNDRRRVLGEYGFNSLFQGHPSSPEGNLFKRSWWQFYREAPKFERIISSWDLTFKDGPSTDFVVGLVIGQRGAEFYVLDCIRQRMDITETLPAIINTSQKWKLHANVIEDKANGPAVISLLRSRVPGLIAVNPQGGKFSRASAISPLVEAGQVFLPQRSHWTAAFVEEHAAFPNGKNDDQVDALSQGLSWLRSRAPITSSVAVNYGQGGLS